MSDIAPYTIFGGNPAKFIRQRFDDEMIETLLEVAWWNWDIEKITHNLEKIVAADIEALINCEQHRSRTIQRQADRSQVAGVKFEIVYRR